MRLYRETKLRKLADKPTLVMLDLWHSLSKQEVGTSIEVMIGNRREHPQLKTFCGELYTAKPITLEEKVVLSLWLDPINMTWILVSHEIGHWVLKLQGFRGMICRPEPHCNIEILLNSMAHHPPLYTLQRSLGHEPQMEIDSLADHNIRLLIEQTETIGERQDALIFANDLLNCSYGKSVRLREILKTKNPETLRLVDKILDVASHHNLLSPEDNLKFEEEVIRELELGSKWDVPDEVRELQLMVERAVESKTSRNVNNPCIPYSL